MASTPKKTMEIPRSEYTPGMTVVCCDDEVGTLEAHNNRRYPLKIKR